MKKRGHTGVLIGLAVFTLTVMIGAVGCKSGGGTADIPLPDLADTSFQGYDFEQVTASNIPVTYTPFCMATEYMQEKEVYGDGCQWPVAFDCSADGSLMLYGIDVAGVYRSVDHGRTWHKCMTGIVNRGVDMFGIDPKNPTHVLAAGLSGSSASNTGMYISYDGCETWRPTGFNLKIGGERYLWDGLAFDPTSYKETEGICKTAYYSVPYQRDRERRSNAYALPKLATNMAEEKAGLYRSTDGGESFFQLSNDIHLADGILKITENGNILIGNQYGLYRIDASGNILNRWLNNDFTDYASDKVTLTLKSGVQADVLKCHMGVTGLDCVNNTAYIQTWEGVYTLDLAKTSAQLVCSLQPQLIASENYKSENWGQFLKVSASDPLHMVYQYRSRVDKVGWDTYWVNYVDVSFDGGKTWTKGEADGKTVFTAGSWNGREKLFIIDPSDDRNVLCFGSDTVMRSDDGGLNFVQASGISNMMCGGKSHFNYYDDRIILSGAQDYGGTVSLDGGKTFRRLIVKGDGVDYGHMYDAFAADAYTYFGTARESWYGTNHLVVTHDGGASWTDTGISSGYGTPSISLQSYNDPDILFSGAYRSVDRGYTWQKMKDCICVCTVSYGRGHELIGYDADRNILISRDDGLTWETAFDRVTHKFNDSPRTVSESIRDLSYDHVNRIVYAAVDSHHVASGGNEYNSHAFYKIYLDENLKFTERKRLPVHDDSDGYENFSDIEVDPNATNVVYVALAGNYFSNKYALQRSLDGGETWQVLTSNTETEPSLKGLCTNKGGFEASMLAVDPLTGRLLVGCGCYGFEWCTPPYDSSLLKHTAPQNHTVAYVYGGEVVHTETVKNNRTVSYLYDTEGLTFSGWYTDGELKNPWKEGTPFTNSCYLYAKMQRAEQITFYVNGETYAKWDIEDYNPLAEPPQPKIEGYCFAGWYADENLTQLVDFGDIEKSFSVYAGFYATEGDVFDKTQQDLGAYLQFSNRRLSSADRVSFDEECDNRCAYIELEADCSYMIAFRMDVRFRYGLNRSDFVKNKEPDKYWISDRDTNGAEPVGEWVYHTFRSGDCTKLLLFYYTSASQSGLSYQSIRESISIYKLVGELVYRIERKS